MQKILLTTLIAVYISACGGGGGGSAEKTTAAPTSPTLQRSDLQLSDESLGAIQNGNKSTLSKPQKSISPSYNPNYKVDVANAKIQGNSTMQFHSDGRITLNYESCVTSANDCQEIREAVLKGGTLLIKGMKDSDYKKADTSDVYTRGALTVSDNQKIPTLTVKNAFGALANTFDMHLLNTAGLSTGNRSSLKGASWIDVVNGKKDVFHDSSAKYYFHKDGVHLKDGDKVHTIIMVISSKKNVFAKHARLGIFAMLDTKLRSAMFTNITGDYTTTANLSKVGANYKKTGGYHAMGSINTQEVYMRGDVDIKIDVSNQEITQFDVNNMKYNTMAISGTGNDTPFISNSAKLQLQGGNAIKYDNTGVYTGTLTEGGGSAGQSGKWDAQFEGNFFGPNAEETAGAVTMSKNGDPFSMMIGGYAAEKQ